MEDIAPGEKRPTDHQILWAEMKQVSWSILHHSVIITLLATRLLVLPFTFWYTKLNVSVHSVWPTAWRFIKYVGIAARGCVPGTVKQHPIITDCIFRFRAASARARQMVRVVHALYNLGLLLDENPEFLRSRRASSARQMRDRRMSTLTHSSRDGFAQYATASQAYHAALANDHNTLDDLLAGFNDNTEGSVSTRGYCGTSGNANTDSQWCRQRAQHRNSSIQTTPERMLTLLQQPLQPRIEQSEAALELEGDPSSDNDRTVTEISPRAEISPSSVISASVSSIPDSATVKHLETQKFDDDKTSSCSHESNHGPEGCPREIAKQAQSRLPRRRSSPPGLSSQRSVEGSTDKDRRRPTAIIEPLTPTKKGKLQRRPRTPRR